jgi:hypothetical protein
LRVHLAPVVGGVGSVLDRKWLMVASVAFLCGLLAMPVVRLLPVRVDWPEWKIPLVPIPSPAPIATDRLSVMVVEDVNHRDDIPASQVTALLSTQLRKAIQDKSGRFRMLDAATDVTNEESWVKECMALPRQSLPWVYISNGRTGYSGPVPATEQAFLELIAKHGG